MVLDDQSTFYGPIYVWNEWGIFSSPLGHQLSKDSIAEISLSNLWVCSDN